ncbi:Transposase, Rhodopirellula-type [sediment metagenome]|uniref:Transposase, Rhodopirellula-type n=1 Tax=sediment metagenome TaxID=749907 RepID=D9PL90_9ZZZZ
MLGRGGITIIHQASGMSRKTIRKGAQEVTDGTSLPAERNRNKGGGRKPLTKTDKTLETDLLALVEDSSQGDPESSLRWTNKSLRTLSKELVNKNHAVSHTQAGHILKANNYRLQGNKKIKEGTKHPDRDAQFRHIANQAKAYLSANDPVISVDAKKKELVGNFKNNGRTWLPTGKPIEVNTHDFPDPKQGKVAPYGVYDISSNSGYVNVGINHDTGEFAVASVRRWWEHLGQERYPKSKKILVTADAGGSNGYRLRLWKKELQTFSDESGLEITVCHFPPGTSKWNKIEHKLFSFISINWKGKPLTSYKVIVNLIANTKTATGLKVYATLDDRIYKLKRKITDKEMKQLRIEPDEFHGEWNYTIKPRK